MPLDALALLVLADFDGGCNVHSYFNGAKEYHTALYQQDGIEKRLAEAWGWLEANALVCWDPSQSTPTSRMITEAGRHALTRGLDRLKAGQRLGVELHPLIADRVRPQFLMGEFELAALAAMREVEIRVRSLGGSERTRLVFLSWRPHLARRVLALWSIAKQTEASKRQ